MSLFNKKNKKNNTKRDEIARFFVDEVKFSPGIRKKEYMINRIIMYFLPLLTVVSVTATSLSCCDINVNTVALAIVIIILHTLIHFVVYEFSRRGKRFGISVMIISYVALVLVLKNILKEGLLYIVDEYLYVLNNNTGSDFTLDYKLGYNEHAVVFVFLVVFMAFMLFLFNYLTVCYTSRFLFTLFSVPWLIMPMAAALRPKQPYFVIYAMSLLTFFGTKTFPKKRVNPSRKNTSGAYKRFVDSPVCQAMYCALVIFIISFVIASISIPKKIFDKEYMIERHLDTEYKVKTKIKDTEDKYSIESKWLDSLFGVDDLKIGDVEQKQRRRSAYTNLNNGRLGEMLKNLMDLADTPNPALVAELSNKYVTGAKSFYNGYIHGNLNNTINASNLNTNKIYDFFFEDTGYEMESVYLKNYDSVYYSKGNWSNEGAEFGEAKYEDYDEVFRDFYEQVALTDFNGNILNGERQYKISQESPSASDNITKYLISHNVRPSKSGGKMSVTYTLPNENPMTTLLKPGGMEHYSEFAKKYLDWLNGSNSSNIADFVMERYDYYIQIPDEVKDVADYARNEFMYNGMRPNEYIASCILEIKNCIGIEYYDDEEFYYLTSDYDEIDSYNEYAAAAINYVQGVFSSGYTYTLSPKKTQGTDPVYDFVFNTHEGYCMHFASAATIMLRALGVPARYVEGYMIDSKTLNDALKSGSRKVDGKDMASTGIYGTNAHAWVEVYFDMLGWVPVEVTLGTSANGNSFYDVSRSYREEKAATRIQPQPTSQPDKQEEKKEEEEVKDSKEDKSASNGEDTQSESSFAKVSKRIIKIVAIVLLIVLCLAVVVTRIRKIRYNRRRKLRTTKGAYRFITKKILKKADDAGVNLGGSRHYLEMAETFAKQDEYMNDEDAKAFMTILRRATYSRDGVTAEDVENLKGIYNRYMDKVCKNRNGMSAFVHEKLLGEIVSL